MLSCNRYSPYPVYIHTQVYDIINKSSGWWLARLVRDMRGGKAAIGQQGWVPGTFLDKFSQSLSHEEEAAYWRGIYIMIILQMLTFVFILC